MTNMTGGGRTGISITGRMLAVALVMLVAVTAVLPFAAQAEGLRETQLYAILTYGRSLLGSTEYDGYCQRFVRLCYSAGGLNAPYNAPSAADAWDWWGISTSRDNIPIGACLYFNTSVYGHVGIYTGEGRMLHAVSTVKEETISSYFWDCYLGWGYQTGTAPTGSYYEYGEPMPAYSLSANTSYPPLNDIQAGEGYPVRGTLTCDYLLDHVEVRIEDEHGSTLQSASSSGGGFTANLSQFDSSIIFGQLPVGRYWYCIIASCVIDGATVVVEVPFNIGSYAPDIPVVTTVTDGCNVSLSWSDTADTEAYNVTIYCQAAACVSGSFDADTCSASFVLAEGEYTAAVEAVSSLFWQVSSTGYVDFAVEHGEWVPTVTDITYPAMNQLAVGQSFPLRGLIVSDRPITYVSLTVSDEHGNAVLSASATPNANEFNIRTLDSLITFGSLAQGRYVYEVYIESSLGEAAVIHSSRFNVGYVPPCAPTVLVRMQADSTTISGLPLAVLHIRAGEYVESISVSVFNSRGRLVYSCDTASSVVRLPRLAGGSYTAVITAADSRFWDSTSSTEIGFCIARIPLVRGISKIAYQR